MPRAVAERLDRRVLVVLDEFQAIAEVERADAIIRSQIQHHAAQPSASSPTRRRGWLVWRHGGSR